MIQIAIDGPAGAGKSTVAKEVAKRLGIHYLDTGAMYRAMAVAVLEQGIDICEHEKVQQALEKIEISVVYTQKGQRVLANGVDLTDKIRTPQATKGSSDIAVTLRCVWRLWRFKEMWQSDMISSWTAGI